MCRLHYIVRIPTVFQIDTFNLGDSSEKPQEIKQISNISDKSPTKGNIYNPLFGKQSF